MRITFISPSINLSGGIKVMAIYAERLMARGHTVHIVSLPSEIIPFNQKLKSFVKGRGWPVDETESAAHLAGRGIEHHVIDRLRPITDGDVPDSDVVIATWWETAEWVARLSPSKGAKAYFIQHHEVFDYLPVDRVRATWRLPLQKIVISKWLADLAAQEYGDDDIKLVPNSVDTEQFHAAPRQKQQYPTVGLLYSHVGWKGVDVSLKALRSVAQRFPNLAIRSFGTERVSNKLPLPSGAVFEYRPAQNKIRDIYAQCDVWLCGSYSEGFHLPPLEAMACRCPVVSTGVGGPVDIIEQGENGYLAPIGDSAALADRLMDVLSLDEARWRVMSDAAFNTATRYTWDDATDLMEEALVYALRRKIKPG